MPVDGMVGIAFGDRAVAVSGTSDLVPDTGDRDAPDRKVGGGDARHFATVAGGVV